MSDLLDVVLVALIPLLLIQAAIAVLYAERKGVDYGIRDWITALLAPGVVFWLIRAEARARQNPGPFVERAPERELCRECKLPILSGEPRCSGCDAEL